jgi:hypothetical protein
VQIDAVDLLGTFKQYSLNCGKHKFTYLRARKRNRWAPALTFCFSLFFTAAAGGLFPQRLSAAAAYIQGNYKTPQSPQTAVLVPYSVAQTAGNLNVVIVGWSDSTAHVSSVADSAGNVYRLAVGPTVTTRSQAIYYANNILTPATGMNSVTVTFDVAAVYPDIRILEYSGIDPNNPVDVVASGSGNSTASNTNAVTTTYASDLLVAGNDVKTITTGAGSGFTKRLLTSPDGDIAEHRSVTANGSYSATAPLSSAGAWVM